MMKKFFATLLCLALVAGLFAACSGSKDDNTKTDSKKVGIAVLSENGAFTDMRTGIESKLKEKYGDNVTCVYKNAAGDAASLSTIVSDFDNGDYDAVFKGTILSARSKFTIWIPLYLLVRKQQRRFPRHLMWSSTA